MDHYRELWSLQHRKSSEVHRRQSVDISPIWAKDTKKVSVDLIRLGRFMKGAINSGSPGAIGIHVQGTIARFYRMELKGPGVYLIQQYSTSHIPEQQSQLAQAVLYFEALSKTQVMK
ncbi:hypothetical protein B0O80DRAFT_205905 [Mortierella sp. GBAus27b]|nr:hypothetical protein B0O80DRAFT_205905 [Mortierella sp. GBAus27b]